MKDFTHNPTIQIYLFLFFLASILGFLWESFLLYLQAGIWAKRGFFYGPWLPIYGTGTVLLVFFLVPFRRNFFLCFVSSAFLGSVTELLLGVLLHQFFGLRYWDYTEWFMNYHGYICLFSMLGFGICGSLFLHYLYPHLFTLWYRIPSLIRKALLIVLSLLILFDTFLALSSPRSGHGITF